MWQFQILEQINNTAYRARFAGGEPTASGRYPLRYDEVYTVVFDAIKMVDSFFACHGSWVATCYPVTDGTRHLELHVTEYI